MFAKFRRIVLLKAAVAALSSGSDIFKKVWRIPAQLLKAAVAALSSGSDIFKKVWRIPAQLLKAAVAARRFYLMLL